MVSCKFEKISDAKKKSLLCSTYPGEIIFCQRISFCHFLNLATLLLLLLCIKTPVYIESKGFVKYCFRKLKSFIKTLILNANNV